MNLTDYINENHKGNKSDFARSQNVTPQSVNKWINSGWIVIDGMFYSPRRAIIGEVCEAAKTYSKSELIALLNQSIDKLKD